MQTPSLSSARILSSTLAPEKTAHEKTPIRTPATRTTPGPAKDDRSTAEPKPRLRGRLSRWRRRWVALPTPVRPSGGRAMGPGQRLLVAALSLALLISGLIVRAVPMPTGLTSLGPVLLALFLVFGVGAAVMLNAGRLTAISFAVYAVSAGLAASIGVGMLLAETAHWSAGTAFVVVITLAAVLLLRSITRDAKELHTARREAAPVDVVRAERNAVVDRAPTRRVVNVVTSVLALAGLALACLDAIGHATEPQPGGLIATVGPLWFIGCAVLVLSFGYALWTRAGLVLPVLSAGTVVIASQALLYHGPTVMAAARHIGMIEYIRTFGRLNTSVDIYQAWPGLFASSAWLIDASGLHSPVNLATWWPVLVTPASIAAVRLVAGRFLSPNRAWIAAGIYAIGDAVNSTYFSPQAVGFLLSFAVLALLVAPPAHETRGPRLARIGLALALSCASVVTHQISPFILGFTLIALVAFRLVKPIWVPLLALLPAVGWAAVHVRLLLRYLDLGALGNVVANMAAPEHPNAVAGTAPVTRLAFYVPGAALVVIGLIALTVVIRRRDRLHIGLAFAVASPAGLAFLTNYGQEGIFRIVLFAVPWLGILAATAVLPSRSGSPAPNRIAQLVLAGGFAVMMAVNTYGQAGLDWARILRPGDAAVTSYFERTAPYGSLLYSFGTKNATPARITERYDQVGYLSRVALGGFPATVGADYSPQQDVAATTSVLSRLPIPGRHYLYVSNALGGYDDRYGLQRYADFQRARTAIAASSDWTLVDSSPTAQLYVLTKDLTKGSR